MIWYCCNCNSRCRCFEPCFSFCKAYIYCDQICRKAPSWRDIDNFSRGDVYFLKSLPIRPPPHVMHDISRRLGRWNRADWLGRHRKSGQSETFQSSKNSDMYREKAGQSRLKERLCSAEAPSYHLWMILNRQNSVFLCLMNIATPSPYCWLECREIYSTVSSGSMVINNSHHLLMSFWRFSEIILWTDTSNTFKILLYLT